VTFRLSWGVVLHLTGFELGHLGAKLAHLTLERNPPPLFTGQICGELTHG
jgi:hypothetical protein